MKKLLLATAAGALLAGAASAEEIKLGMSLGFTGPLESMAPGMRSGAELAMKEVSDSGLLLDGSTVIPVQGDSTCTDAAAATATVERLITAEGVKGIVGGMCSGEAIASLQNVAVPNGVVMISPSATSPALSTIEDNGLFFRTSPSDARQGEVMAEIMMEKGIKNAAITYTNNDYGKGLADAFAAAFQEKGGTVTVNSAHDDGKADYSAEVAALAAAGGDALVVAGYVDQGGSGVVRAAAEGEGREKFLAMAEEAGFEGTSAYSAEAYDAAALMLLSMAAAKSSDPNVWKNNVMDVANEPGEKILPGELAKGLEILNGGGDIDYVGASSIEMVGAGETAGVYREVSFDNGEMTVVGYR